MIEKVTCKGMKHLLSLMVLVSLALSPGSLWAVQFDMWETGMDMNEIVSVARKYNIPIARSGIVHGYSKFDQKLLDDRFFKASVLEYRTKVGEYGSKVLLKLSDQPKQLYEIEVGIYGIKHRDDFLKEMIGILKQKYGTYKERKEFVFTYLEWKPDANSQIILRMSSVEASVFYTDPRMKEVVETRRKEKEIDAIRKGGKTF